MSRRSVYDKRFVNIDVNRQQYRSQEQQHGSSSERAPRENNPDHDRSWWNRAGDEVLSWFGDEYAVRRRRHDEGPHRGKGPKGYTRSDERIREDVMDRLTDEWHVDATEIEVSVVDGEVTLTGYVHERYQKRRAEVVVANIPGVKEVENRIRVNPYNSTDNVNLMP